MILLELVESCQHFRIFQRRKNLFLPVAMVMMMMTISYNDDERHSCFAPDSSYEFPLAS